MKVFIWERVERCSGNYHPEGGVVVFAVTEERARELANSREGCNIAPEEMPDDVRFVLGGDEDEKARHITRLFPVSQHKRQLFPFWKELNCLLLVGQRTTPLAYSRQLSATR